MIDSKRYQEALPLLEQQEQLCLDISDKPGLIPCYANMGLVSSFMGDQDKALDYHQKEEQLCRQLERWQNLGRCLGYQGGVYFEKAEYEKAMQLYQQQEELCRKWGSTQGLVSSLTHQAMILTNHQRQIHRALARIEEALDLAQKYRLMYLVKILKNMEDSLLKVYQQYTRY